MRRPLLLAALTLSVASAAACSSTDATPATPAPADAAPPPDPQPTQDAAPADAGDPACAAEATAIQAGLDAEVARQKVQHATIGLETPRCGVRVFFGRGAGATAAVTDDSLWRIGSVTKTFVSAVILALAADGKLGLDDAVEGYVPGYPNAPAMTVRQLLDHTSGAYNYTTATAFADALRDAPLAVRTPADLLAFASAQAPTFAPGADWSYSNTNYVMLGMVAEKAGGKPIAELVRSLATSKAGLTHTFLDGAEPVTGDLVPGTQSGVDVTRAFHPSVAWAAGAIVSTPRELLTWIHALYGTDRVLSPASKKQLFTFVPKGGYGLGVSQIPAGATLGNGAGVGHGGSIFGYQTQAFWFEQTKTGLVAIVADTGGDPNALSVVALQAIEKK
jgi:D-alanyl-D-alanine carboxypeptidase